MKYIYIFSLLFLLTSEMAAQKAQKRLIYIVSDISIPFWKVMVDGAILSAKQNSHKQEILNSIRATKEKVDGYFGGK